MEAAASRSALSRHRKRRLLEATEHVSPLDELRVVRVAAGRTTLRGRPPADVESTVGHGIRVLRNVKNNVYHRAMAARTLGLLMAEDTALQQRLRLESDVLVDALLQLINYCRRQPTQNADTRRVHVNCCLVISMVMAPAARQQLVVSLDSELLAMPARPVERDSGFLLLTISGRPETAADRRDDPPSENDTRVSRHVAPSPPRAALRELPAARASPPPRPPVAKKPQDTKRQPSESMLVPTSRVVSALPTMAEDLARRSTPTRVFKMDRNRVVTPALTRPSASAVGDRQTPLPTIPPSRGFLPRPPALDGGHDDTDERVESALSSPPPPSAALMQSAHMVEILRTGRMPVATPQYFHEHLRDGTASTQGRSRLQVVEWAAWQRAQSSGVGSVEVPTPPTPGRFSEPTPTPSADKPPSALRQAGEEAEREDIDTPEFKRHRLREILSSPIDPLPGNTQRLNSLADRVNTSVLSSLDAQLQELRRADDRARLEMRAMIDAERDKLPLRFLFQLPGGAAYCRQRMRRAMELWVHEFEANQMRMALLQWKAVVEQGRYRARGEAYHRLAVEKRMRVAIEFVLRGFQAQAFARWVEAVRPLIWRDRDAAVRVVQRQVRRRLALLAFLAHCEAFPFSSPRLRDGVRLAPYRGLPFEIPRVVRETRRRLWSAAELVQGVFRLRRFRGFLRRFRVAATAIQAQARRRIAQQHYRSLLRRIVLFQAQVRMQRCARAFRRVRDAAVLVQLNFRAVRVRRMRRLVLHARRRASERVLSAALSLQRVARGWLGRLDARRRRRERDEEFHAALVVQRAWYRRNNEWSTFLLLGCLREQEAEDEALRRLVLAFQHGHMARVIQRAWRELRCARRHAAAVVVQRNVRRWRATRIVQRRRRELMAHRRLKWFLRVRHRVRVETATRLQFWWLRVVPRRLEQHLRARRLRAERQRDRDRYRREYAAASVIAALARGRRGRRRARAERSARCVQRAVRAFLAWRRYLRELAAIRRATAQLVAAQWLGAAVNAVRDRRLATLHAAAREIQRLARGVGTRLRLARALVGDELRHRMACRLQQLWRQNAQRRVARRVLRAQRRRAQNPFRASGTSVAAVLADATRRAGELVDLEDDVRGLHAVAWLRRLGLDDKYLSLVESHKWLRRESAPVLDGVGNELHAAGDGGLAALRRHVAGADNDACRAALEELLGVSDDEDLDAMATSLRGVEILRAAKTLRARCDREKTALALDERRHDVLQRQLTQATDRRDALVARLDELATETREFRHPPKALRDAQKELSQQLTEALADVERARKEQRRAADACTTRRQALAALQSELSTREKEEVSALYDRQLFRLLLPGTAGERVARELFLQAFPGLEARATTFVRAIAESPVSQWQLVRFFRQNTTIAAVKAFTRTLVEFDATSDMRRYDLARWNACADVLQYACERVCELLAVPVEALALGQPQSTGNGLTATVVALFQDAVRQSQPAQRAYAWLRGVQRLVEMNAVATRLQAQWRRRCSKRVVAMLRRSRWKTELQAAYLADIHGDYVTPLWRAERERERKELDEWEAATRRAEREELLAQTLRFPFQEEWYDDGQYMAYFREDASSGERIYVEDGTRPVYTVDEEDAAIRIQALGRRYLARLEALRRQRAERRQRYRQSIERLWRAAARERAQTTTLRLELHVTPDATVSALTRTRSDAVTRARQAAAPKTRGKKQAAAATDQKTRVSRYDSLAALEKAVAPIEIAWRRQYDRSVRAEHRRHTLFPLKSRPPNAHAGAIVDLLEQTQRLQRCLAPHVAGSARLQYTKGCLRFGWRAVQHETGRPEYFVHEATRETSWDKPEYSFDDEFAAIKMQSLVRMLVAQNRRLAMLEAVSLVDLVHDAVRQAERIGWVGFGLEGMSTAVYLSRLGLSKLVPKLGKLKRPDDVCSMPEAKLKTLGCTKEEIAVIRAAPTRLPCRAPLLPSLTALDANAKHAFNALPSERVVTQLVSQAFPNQQGRVLGLVRAIKGSSTPVSYRQLEMHLRLYAGRPDDALAHVSEIASLPFATQEPQEHAIARLFVRGLARCVVWAANLRLRSLHASLTLVLRVALAAAPRSSAFAPLVVADTTPLARVPDAELAAAAVLARRRYPDRVVKGLWEMPIGGASDDEAPAFSFAQVALYVRECGLQLVLRFVRSVVLAQAQFRMLVTRRWYLALLAFRAAAATTLQCAWRVHVAVGARQLLESQQRSDYEQGYERYTRSFFYVYRPTQEKLLEEPRDHRGALLPFRPMVQDRVTKRWMLAWPHLDRKGRRGRHDEQGDDDEWGLGAGASPCSVCHAERAVRRCNECFSPAGDYVDHCLACWYDRHAGDSSWHSFTTFHALRQSQQAALPRAVLAFHCVECKRFSTLRCLMCREHYCERCFARVHRRGHTRVRHTSEAYAPQAEVCVECEARVAFQRCLVCGDGMCEDCLARSHAHGARAAHELRLLRQPLAAPEHVYCEQCHARRGDLRCEHCALALCAVCLGAPERHGVLCPETALQQRQRELLGDRVCVDCGRPADRACDTFGDRYCSVRWMGNPGCFERFHRKGRRADHTCSALEAPPLPPELLALEDAVRTKRRRDAEAAEAEAKRLAAEMLQASGSGAGSVASGSSPGTPTPAVPRPRPRRRKTARGKTSASATVCSVAGCGAASLSVQLSFCARHLTLQHALEITRSDPLEAAKLLALLDKHGGRLPETRAGPLARVWQALATARRRPKTTKPEQAKPKQEKSSAKKTKKKEGE
ncbi:hypothetical protein ATCC90586_007680 [Pythium insidiosum]|nr:hypothetical protein ATCC90586_007680 [Pythium insidiosum]